MGVTIHFEGKLKAGAYDSVIGEARAFANAHGWRVRDIERHVATLARVRDEKDWDYVGPVHGIELTPHQQAEPLRLEFDEDLYVQEYIKTQFAPTEIHVAVTQLLRHLQPHFEQLIVIDEGEYYESHDLEKLEGHREWCAKVIEAHLAEGGFEGPVQLPSGRIVDLRKK